MNRNQSRVLLGCALLVVLMCAYPPFTLDLGATRPKLNLGYGWLFQPPQRGALIGTVNISLLVLQLGVVCLIGVLLYLALGNAGGGTEGVSPGVGILAHSNTPQSQLQSQPITSDMRPAPWRRLFARTLDMSLISAVSALILIRVRTQSSGHRLSKFFESVDGWAAFTLLWTPGLLLIEWVILVIIGNTLGKALYGLAVERDDKLRPAPWSTLCRLLRLWGSGLGFSLPIIGILTCLYQYMRLSRRGQTSYDSSFAKVSAVQVGGGRLALAGVLTITAIAASLACGLALLSAPVAPIR